MNIILFDPTEVEHRLPLSDFRATHLLTVLRLNLGGKFDAGIIDGPVGKGTLVAKDFDSLTLSFIWLREPAPLYPIHLVVGLPRPQTARDILRDATTLGVSSINFVTCDQAEASYASSSLWKSGDWRKCVISGASQAFCTRLPQIDHGNSLGKALGELPLRAERIALDNYEARQPLGDFTPANDTPAVIAVGPERGWSGGERLVLQSAGFRLLHLGPRVLRTETAVVAAVSLVRTRLGLS